jgi:hypothetical protein
MYVDVCVCECVYVCMNVCMWMYVCMYVYVCMDGDGWWIDGWTEMNGCTYAWMDVSMYE